MKRQLLFLMLVCSSVCSTKATAQTLTISAKDDAGCIAGGLVGLLLGNSTTSKSSSIGSVNGTEQIGGIVGSPYLCRYFGMLFRRNGFFIYLLF